MRQGDPLSPLLFVLSMEYLSRLLAKASHTEGFKFLTYCRKLQLVHQMFADDLLVFCAADVQTIACIIKAFTEFSPSSGLVANLSKSQIVFRDVGIILGNKFWR